MVVNQHLVGTFLVTLDLGGTFVFALSGGMTGVKHQLDLFGILVLSFAAAVGAIVCLGLRLMAIRYGWHLPTARGSHPADSRKNSLIG
jgi:uncharacterized membrane protein YeiH